MIEDKEHGIKIAENPREALIRSMIENTEKRIISTELEQEINKVVLKFLKEQKV